MNNELKNEYKSAINNLKKGLIDKNANLDNKIGLIGSDAERLKMIKVLLKQYADDIRFYRKIEKNN
jgi:hypothetical protein